MKCVDDTKLEGPVNSEEDQNTMQRELDGPEDRSNGNGMKANSTKCKIQPFRMNNKNFCLRNTSGNNGGEGGIPGYTSQLQNDCDLQAQCDWDLRMYLVKYFCDRCKTISRLHLKCNIWFQLPVFK